MDPIVSENCGNDISSIQNQRKIIWKRVELDLNLYMGVMRESIILFQMHSWNPIC